MPRHLVLDCDPGCDDALAIFMALDAQVYSSMDVLTVAGNVGVEQTTANAVRILYLALACLDNGPTVHVYKGCHMSLDGVRPSAASIHGRDGLGDVPFNVFVQTEADRKKFGAFRTECLREKAKTTATHRYLELLRNASQLETKLDLVCTGPLTNIASTLLLLGPEEQLKFWTIWERVVIMGGALGVQGNISHSAEFNCHADPLAVNIVLDSLPKSKPEDGKVPIFVTLDCTEKVSLLWEEVEGKWKTLKNRPLEEIEPEDLKALFTLCMLQKYFMFHGLVAMPNKRLRPVEPRDVMWLRDCSPAGVDELFRCRQRPADYRTEKWGSLKAKNTIGSSGLKEIPRFCYLHDPLAMWVALQDQYALNNLLKPTNMYVIPELSLARGRTLQVERRPYFFVPDGSNLESNGTDEGLDVTETAGVLTLDSKKFHVKKHVEQFMISLRRAISMPKENKDQEGFS